MPKKIKNIKKKNKKQTKHKQKQIVNVSVNIDQSKRTAPRQQKPKKSNLQYIPPNATPLITNILPAIGTPSLLDRPYQQPQQLQEIKQETQLQPYQASTPQYNIEDLFDELVDYGRGQGYFQRQRINYRLPTQNPMLEEINEIATQPNQLITNIEPETPQTSIMINEAQEEVQNIINQGLDLLQTPQPETNQLQVQQGAVENIDPDLDISNILTLDTPAQATPQLQQQVLFQEEEKDYYEYFNPITRKNKPQSYFDYIDFAVDNNMVNRTDEAFNTKLNSYLVLQDMSQKEQKAFEKEFKNYLKNNQAKEDYQNMFKGQGRGRKQKKIIEEEED